MKNWHSFFMKIAELFSERSTCTKIKVGSVITRKNRIISTGYNGVASKKEHCNLYFFKKWRETDTGFENFEDYTNSEKFLKEHKVFSNLNELHSEQNAILFAKQSLEDCSLYTTLSPCTFCAKMIVASGIKWVFYKDIYENGEGLDILINNNIDVRKIGD